MPESAARPLTEGPQTQALPTEKSLAASRLPRKNIVLCADGTGNRGGETPDSNVYRIYKAIELHDPLIEQVKFYDNGVGTAKNKYWRAISGAFGGGFKSNVCDLYQFLARSYDPGDRIYLFGFSRGAATIRAFSGFVATCGLLDGRDLHQSELRKRTEAAFKAYWEAREHQRGEAAARLREVRAGQHGVVPIEFLGVWDTVAALGLPQGFKGYGLLVRLFGIVFNVLEFLIDKIFPHRFYNFELTDNVRHACHAISIDDERKTFLPLIWDEWSNASTQVEQVFFAGVHSNVGGGYARMGLSSVALEWMMVRAEACGLHFADGAMQKARDEANPHGRLFDSRDGAAIFYRLQPRFLEDLCEGKLRGKIKVHASVRQRVQRRTANYAPALLPYECELVTTSLPAPGAANPVIRHGGAPDLWRRAQERVKAAIGMRQGLYTVFLETTIALVLTGIYFWIWRDPVDPAGAAAWRQQIWSVVEYILPKIFESFAAFVILEADWYWQVLAVAVPLSLVYLMGHFRCKEIEAREDARKLMIGSGSEAP